MVNRNTSEDRALKRFASGVAREAVDAAFFPAVQSFIGAITPRQRKTMDPRLISGWMLHEVARRLGSQVLVVENAGAEMDGRIWIADGGEALAIERLVRDLGRGKRVRVTAETMAVAFDALVRSFRAHSVAMASFGLAHERPANTQRLRAAILDGFSRSEEDE
jgi:hypothetical protein